MQKMEQIMASLHISQGMFRLSDTRILSLNQVELQRGESWAFVGANGSGKSSLARALSGELPPLAGSVSSDFRRPVRLSLEQLQTLVAQEWQRNNTDMLSEGEEDTGLTVAEVIQAEVQQPERCEQLAQQFGIEALLSRRFKYLSTGETRKTLLCQALMNQPDLLILDEPFDGLDVASRASLTDTLRGLQQPTFTLVLVLNRFDDIPEFIQQVGVLAECTLTHSGPRQAHVRAICELVRSTRPRSFPAVLVGDLNADPSTDELRMLTGKAAVPVPGVVFRDAWEAVGHREPGFTWSKENPFAAANLDVDRRIDHVLVGAAKLGGVGNVLDARIAGNEPVDGMWPSDHLAMVAELRY